MRVGGIVKNKESKKDNPSVAYGDSSPYTEEPWIKPIINCPI